MYKKCPECGNLMNYLEVSGMRLVLERFTGEDSNEGYCDIDRDYIEVHEIIEKNYSCPACQESIDSCFDDLPDDESCVDNPDKVQHFHKKTIL